MRGWCASNASREVLESSVAGSWRRMIPYWSLIVWVAALARALAQPAALLNDPDTYLHIAAGRWMLALVYDAAGWSGLVMSAAACFALSIALFTR
jgi:hypothetical protein